MTDQRDEPQATGPASPPASDAREPGATAPAGDATPAVEGPPGESDLAAASEGDASRTDDPAAASDGRPTDDPAAASDAVGTDDRPPTDGAPTSAAASAAADPAAASVPSAAAPAGDGLGVPGAAGQTVGGQPVEGQPVGQTVEGQPVGGQQVGGQPVEAPAAEGPAGEAPEAVVGGTRGDDAKTDLAETDVPSGPPVGDEAAPVVEPMPASDGGAPVETPVAVAGEQIEWQPVVIGDQIEWQPVMSSEAETPWPTDASFDDVQPAYPEYDEGEYGNEDPEGAWDVAAAPVTGNGAPGPGVPTSSSTRPGRAGSRAQPRPGAGPRARPGPSPPRTPSDGGAPPKAKRQVVILSILTAAVVLVAVFGFVLSRGAGKKGGAASPSSTTVPIVTVPPADLVTFRDDQTGFTVKYPKSWQQLGAPLSDIRLTLDAGGNDGMQVRIFPIQTPATTDNIANLKAVTDTIVFGDQTSGKQEIQEQLVTLNGRLTYYYIYTFPDPVSSQQGVHVTYFVFEGHRMFEMVFQAVPADDFRAKAGIFDQIAESFTVEPEKTTTTSPPTTAAPSTTVP